MINQIKEQVGEAYGFFDCNASKEEIESLIPTIRESAKISSKLELFLVEGPNECLMAIPRAVSEGISFNKEYDLVATAIKNRMGLAKNRPRFARLNQIIDIYEIGARYAMIARYPGATNKKTADELSAVLIQTSQSHLYQEGEDFRVDIFYEKNGEYFFRN